MYNLNRVNCIFLVIFVKETQETLLRGIHLPDTAPIFLKVILQIMFPARNIDEVPIPGTLVAVIVYLAIHPERTLVQPRLSAYETEMKFIQCT